MRIQILILGFKGLSYLSQNQSFRVLNSKLTSEGSVSANGVMTVANGMLDA